MRFYQPIIDILFSHENSLQQISQFQTSQELEITKEIVNHQKENNNKFLIVAKRNCLFIGTLTVEEGQNKVFPLRECSEIFEFPHIDCNPYRYLDTIEGPFVLIASYRTIQSQQKHCIQHMLTAKTMVASESQSIVDFYPIVVELDDETLDSCGSNSASIYKTVASEASWFDSERSSRWDEERVQSDILTRESEHDFPPSPPSVKRSQMHDGDEFGRNTEVGSVFATIRSLLQLGYDREHDETNMDGKMTIEPLGSNPAPKAVHCSKASPISPIPSPNRVVTKRYRPKRFHDDYVLTRQVR